MLENLKIEKCYDGFLYQVESTRNPPKLESHHHVELELNFVVRGSITYVIDGQCFTFRERTLLWLFPEQEHQLVDQSSDAQCYVVVFKPSLIKRSCRTPAYDGLIAHVEKWRGVLSAVLQPDSFDLIRKVMDSLMQDSLDPDLLNREAGFGASSDFSFHHNDPDALNAGLRYLLLLCWRTFRIGRVSGKAVPLHPAVRCVLRLLTENDRELNLGQLAEACGVSEAYLSRTFARQIGVPLCRYRNSLRLSRFWEEYRYPEQKTLAEAVYAAGFGSYAQFYKVFAREYGRGPRACFSQG